MPRHMASIKEVLDISPIENADSIELATIDGWRSVIKKGQFNIGEKVVFCEPDSLLPDKPEFEFMRSKNFRIRTCRLRGTTSQGICFPMSILPEGSYLVDDDVSELLGITKYEPPVPVQLRGRVRCPIHRLAVPKTDEVRVQNIPKILEKYRGNEFNLTEKIDGTSMSVYVDPESGLHVCSRNVDLAPDFEHKFNGDAYWRYALEHDIEEVLKQLGNVALQGELFGEGIQKNKYGLRGLHYRVFNVWDMTNHKYFDWDVIRDAVDVFGLGKEFLVPYLSTLTLEHTVDDLLELANGKSTISDTLREGIVFRPLHETQDVNMPDGRLSWKAVSNQFLLKWGE